MKYRFLKGIVILAFAIFFLNDNASAISSDIVTSISSGPEKIYTTSIKQNGIELSEKYSQELGISYFDTVRSSATIQVTFRPENLQNDIEYNFLNKGLTAKDNGKTFTVDIIPAYSWTQYSILPPGIGQIELSLSIQDGNSSTVYSYGSPKIYFKPLSAGTENLEIISAKQNGIELEYENGHFVAIDYLTPIDIVYKINNIQPDLKYTHTLIIGSLGNFNSNQYGGSAKELQQPYDDTEKIFNAQLYLSPVSRIMNLDLYLYATDGQDNTDRVLEENMYSYIYNKDETFTEITNFIIDKIEQNGTEIMPTQQNKFELNNAENIDIFFHVENAVSDGLYVLDLSYAGSGQVFSGSELKNGIKLTLNPRKYPANYSLKDLAIGIYKQPFASTKIPIRFNGKNFLDLHFINDENLEKLDKVELLYSNGDSAKCSNSSLMPWQMLCNQNIAPIYNELNLIQLSKYNESQNLFIKINGSGYNNSIHDIKIIVEENGDYYATTILEYNTSLNGDQINTGTLIELPYIELKEHTNNPYKSGQYTYKTIVDSQEIDLYADVTDDKETSSNTENVDDKETSIIQQNDIGQTNGQEVAKATDDYIIFEDDKRVVIKNEVQETKIASDQNTHNYDRYPYDSQKTNDNAEETKDNNTNGINNTTIIVIAGLAVTAFIFASSVVVARRKRIKK